MRLSLLLNPPLLLERLGTAMMRGRRLAKLRGSVAASLTYGHIDTVELLELLRPFGINTIADIGANVGTWTLLAKAIFPTARVDAFEPLEVHCGEFDKACTGISRVTLHRIALGAQEGTASLRVTKFSDSSSFLPATKAAFDAYGTQEDYTESVAQFRLDDLVRTGTIAAPDLIKLDVQGVELEVLRGASETLPAVKAIIVEVSFVEYYKGQCLFQDVMQFMSDRGFVLYALGANTALAQPLQQADMLFVAAFLVGQISS